MPSHGPSSRRWSRALECAAARPYRPYTTTHSNDHPSVAAHALSPWGPATPGAANLDRVFFDSDQFRDRLRREERNIPLPPFALSVSPYHLRAASLSSLQFTPHTDPYTKETGKKRRTNQQNLQAYNITNIIPAKGLA
ncbi:hypothetical protein GGTG_07855 [Gaeumannomyces tritici R3-111a-1]|uniref:Uncharacterized protein n=1 Tax=Gaeumannomyces tritici (strain R3-111a-1) TaxID=644352 RepID=J3P2W3_GAET3|nr:hypothetical protein GGTG_07855 [Gaeumannomyces tritici R3-111a-1]EJT74005.1 hypothetical protein GGTG_07855 [Gaeumannomyces tritici R3-111a-1]